MPIHGGLPVARVWNSLPPTADFRNINIGHACLPVASAPSGVILSPFPLTAFPASDYVPSTVLAQ